VAAFTILGLGKYTPVFRFFYDYVPAYSLFRGPSKHMFITGFCLAALAGHGWNWLFSIEQPYRCWPARDRRTRTAALVATALLILILTGALTVLKPFQTGKGSVWSLTVAEHLAHPESRTRPLDPNDPVAAAATGDLAMQQLARAFVLLAATASLVLLVSLNVSGKWRRIAAAVLVLTDLTAFAWPFHATFAAEQIAYPAPFMEVLAQSPTPPRIHDFTGPPNVAMTERVSSISGYTGSALRRYNDFFNLSQNLLRGASQAYSIIDSLPPLYQMLALEYVILPQQALNPGMRTVAQAGDIALVAADGSFPRVFLAPDIERVSGYEPALGRVLHAGPGLLQRPVIEDYSGPYNPAPLAASETAAITSFQLNKLLIDTKTLQTRLLVVNEMYYKDWRAEVDGAPTDIYPVNVLFRGVFVPPGEHQVVLYCAAPAFVAGSVISAVSLVALVCGLIVTLAKRRRPHLPTA